MAYVTEPKRNQCNGRLARRLLRTHLPSGTREVISRDMMAWARDLKGTPILWLSGPAGAGKSCIQRKIVQLCTDEGLHVASFFFSIRDSETSNEKRFIPTLVAQLAENIPDLQWYIEHAITNDRRIFTRSLESQVDGLILQPLQALHGSVSNCLASHFWRTLKALVSYQGDSTVPWTTANVVVIDGLDECVGEKEQVHILRLVQNLATHPRFTFRFVIASRPEYAIRTAFSSLPLSKDTLVFRLEEYEADEDLRWFMKTEFIRLKSEHPAAKSIPGHWPSTKDENVLVRKASRQFIYVSTVMKHLSNPRLLNPELELEHIVNYRSSERDSNSNPFAELDALYRRILHPPNADISILKPIFHAITHNISIIMEPSLLSPRPRNEPALCPVKDMDTLLDLAPGTVSSSVVDMHFVVKLDPITVSGLSFHHKSLEDFLTSPSRARELYQSDDVTHLQLGRRYYELSQHCPIPRFHDSVIFTVFHANRVSDWSLFEPDFTLQAIPFLIEREYVAGMIPFRGPILKSMASDFLMKYHSFHCASGGRYLRQCKRLNWIATRDAASMIFGYDMPSTVMSWLNGAEYDSDLVPHIPPANIWPMN